MDLSSKSVIKQGAEAKIYLCKLFEKNVIVKERFSKGYRHPKLDESLGRERTKSEARALMRCRSAGIATPAVYFVDVDRCLLGLEYLDNAITVKEFLTSLSGAGDSDHTVEKRLHILSANIGDALARMHAINLVHGDLTTSNLMLRGPEARANSPLLLIDFGLSHAEASAEDKAVDLYVLERAFISTHPERASVFPDILDSYFRHWKPATVVAEVKRKLEEVRLRGRKRTMLG